MILNDKFQQAGSALTRHIADTDAALGHRRLLSRDCSELSLCRHNRACSPVTTSSHSPSRASRPHIFSGPHSDGSTCSSQSCLAGSDVSANSSANLSCFLSANETLASLTSLSHSIRTVSVFSASTNDISSLDRSFPAPHCRLTRSSECVWGAEMCSSWSGNSCGDLRSGWDKHPADMSRVSAICPGLSSSVDDHYNDHTELVSDDALLVTSSTRTLSECGGGRRKLPASNCLSICNGKPSTQIDCSHSVTDEQSHVIVNSVSNDRNDLPHIVSDDLRSEHLVKNSSTDVGCVASSVIDANIELSENARSHLDIDDDEDTEFLTDVNDVDSEVGSEMLDADRCRKTGDGGHDENVSIQCNDGLLPDERYANCFWTISDRIMCHIPNKYQRGLITGDLSITAVSVTDTHVLIGTSTGSMYWCHMEDDTAERYSHEDVNMSAVSSVTCLTSADYQLASGHVCGSLVIRTVPRYTAPSDSLPDYIHVVEKSCKKKTCFLVIGHHRGKITCLFWSRNGCRLFSADITGCVLLTELNHDSCVIHSRICALADTCVMQLSYLKLHLLVCSARQAFISNIEKFCNRPILVGHRARKSHILLAGCLVESSHNVLRALVFRPGLRLFVANMDGKILYSISLMPGITLATELRFSTPISSNGDNIGKLSQTSFFSDVVADSSLSESTSDASAPHLNTMFYKCNSIDNHRLVAHSLNCIVFIDIRRWCVEAFSQIKDDQIVDASTSSTHTYLLCEKLRLISLTDAVNYVDRIDNRELLDLQPNLHNLKMNTKRVLGSVSRNCFKFANSLDIKRVVFENNDQFKEHLNNVINCKRLFSNIPFNGSISNMLSSTILYASNVQNKRSTNLSFDKNQEESSSQPIITEPSMVNGDTCVRSGVNGDTSVRSGVNGDISVRSGVNGDISVRSGVNGDTSVRSGVNGVTSVRSGVNGDTNVRSGVNGDTSVRSGVNGEISVRSGVNDDTSVRSGVNGISSNASSSQLYTEGALCNQERVAASTSDKERRLMQLLGLSSSCAVDTHIATVSGATLTRNSSELVFSTILPTPSTQQKQSGDEAVTSAVQHVQSLPRSHSDFLSHTGRQRRATSPVSVSLSVQHQYHTSPVCVSATTTTDTPLPSADEKLLIDDTLQHFAQPAAITATTAICSASVREVADEMRFVSRRDEDRCLPERSVCDHSDGLHATDLSHSFHTTDDLEFVRDSTLEHVWSSWHEQLFTADILSVSACLSYTVVVTADNIVRVCYTQPHTDRYLWRVLDYPSDTVQVSVSFCGHRIWRVSSDGIAFAMKHVTPGFAHGGIWVLGAKNVCHIAVDSASVWYIKKAGDLFCQYGFADTCSVVSCEVFVSTPSPVRHLAARDYVVWICTYKGEVYSYTPNLAGTQSAAADYSTQPAHTHCSHPHPYSSVHDWSLVRTSFRASHVFLGARDTGWAVHMHSARVSVLLGVCEQFCVGVDTVWRCVSGLKISHVVLSNRTFDLSSNQSVPLPINSCWLTVEPNRVCWSHLSPELSVRCSTVTSVCWEPYTVRTQRRNLWTSRPRWHSVSAGCVFKGTGNLWTVDTRGRVHTTSVYSACFQSVALPHRRCKVVQLVSIPGCVCILSASGDIYTRVGLISEQCGHSWSRISTEQLVDRKIIHISVGYNSLWVCDADGRIYVRLENSLFAGEKNDLVAGASSFFTPSSMNPAWVNLEAPYSDVHFTQVYVTADSVCVWAVDSRRRLWSRDSVTQDLLAGTGWTSVHSPDVVGLSVTSSSCTWALLTQEHVEVEEEEGAACVGCWNTNKWSRLPCSAHHISVSACGQLWAIVGNNHELATLDLLTLQLTNDHVSVQNPIQAECSFFPTTSSPMSSYTARLETNNRSTDHMADNFSDWVFI